jgi:hypothetical protein
MPIRLKWLLVLKRRNLSKHMLLFKLERKKKRIGRRVGSRDKSNLA